MSIRQHISAYFARQHTSAYVSTRRQHTSAYVSIRQSIREEVTRVCGVGVVAAEVRCVAHALASRQQPLKLFAEAC